MKYLCHTRYDILFSYVGDAYFRDVITFREREKWRVSEGDTFEKETARGGARDGSEKNGSTFLKGCRGGGLAFLPVQLQETAERWSPCQTTVTDTCPKI